MASEVPRLLSTLLIADDAFLAAQISCALAARDAYLPILEAPRMQRPDGEAEVLRCNNVAARMQPTTILFDTGHWVMLNQPERFNQVVAGWLARG